ncbi:GGDEF domain-containing protein [Paenibacillus paeoniae]|uniref:GGDEF domain-containing protein n=1 Tax=Paenibacillus paeoniae TaxID=2292705 RepID=A0A371P0F2_9BACL|nr:GGDEF domain-containing protein [Paenibacillus paeoniae]REK69413.1 GGDEF domain-containing protein [Paenibacillus paeoniae]
MGEIGLGLLHQGLIQSIRNQWTTGFGVAVLYMEVRPDFEAAHPTVEIWEKEEKAIFWKQRLDHEYYFMLQIRNDKEGYRESAEQSMARLREQLIVVETAATEEAGSGLQRGCSFRLGVSLARPDSNTSTETVVYRAIQTAIERSASAVSPIERIPVATAEISYAREPIDKVYPSTNGAQLIGSLASSIAAIPSYAPVSDASYVFDTDAHVPGIVVVREGEPVGLLMREKLHQMLAGQYGLPLYWNRSVERIMDNKPLIVDESMPVERVSQLAMERSDFRLYDVVIITKEGQLSGAASVRAILECMTMLRTEEARSANPLTGLPGNSGIQTELGNRIKLEKPFAMVYADMDFFKWFNDCFGFGLGDELIRYLAHLLRVVFRKNGESDVFVGHIGGDDFIAMMDPEDVEEACRELIHQFDVGVRDFYGGEEVTSVVDRSGNTIQQEGVSLSLSVLVWDGRLSANPGHFSRQAAKLKKRAKAVKGSMYMVERLME